MFIRIFAALSIFSAAAYAQSCPLTSADAKTCDQKSHVTCKDVLSAKPPVSCPKNRRSVIYEQQANAGACTLGIPLQHCSDQRADCKQCVPGPKCSPLVGTCEIALQGDLFMPDKVPAKGAPVLIFNHGKVSCADGVATCSHKPGDPCAIASFFTARGYAVMMPRRRGYSPSTGTFFDDWKARTGESGTTLLKNEAHDVEAAIAFLKSHADAFNLDMSKFVITGHSLGGVVALFTNAEDKGQSAVVSFSGDSESWCGNDALDDALKAAVKNAKTPVYFIEPKNDVDLSPTLQLSHAMGEHLDRFQAAVFGPVTDPKTGNALTCGKEAHTCFVSDLDEVERWGPSVLEWMQRFGVK